MKAMTVASKEMETIASQLRLREAIQSTFPFPTKHVYKIGDKVPVHRQKEKGKRSGPYKQAKIDKEQACFLKFRIPV